MDKIWQYYEDKRIEAKILREKIREEKSKENPNKVILKQLWKKLELAEYVGD